MIEFISQPWPWYISGPLIGLMIPALLIWGNRTFGVSSSLRDICAATVPGKIKFFQYDWKAKSWRLVFVGGIVIGGIVSVMFLNSGAEVAISAATHENLAGFGITNFKGLAPMELFGLESLLTLKGFILICVGGFMVGFGTRYAGGCTSGHSIMGMANLQWPSLVATISFFAGGLLMSHFILPLILSL